MFELVQSRKVFLIGTHHTYQYGVGSSYAGGCSEYEEAAFRQLLRETVRQFGVSLLAEELNEDALAEFGVQESVLQNEAALLGLPHRFCEPCLVERIALGVQQESDLRAAAWMHGWSEEEVRKRLLGEFRKRESVWCDRIVQVGSWPVLFICGADHVDSFSALLAGRGLSGHVVETCWEPTPRPRNAVGA